MSGSENKTQAVQGAKPAGRQNDTPHSVIYLWLSRAAAASIPLFLLIIILAAQTHGEAIFDSPLLIFLLNTVFISTVSLVVVIVAGRAYVRTGILRLLWLGCGALTFGLDWPVSSFLLGTLDGTNRAITVHNLAALIAGLFFLSVAAVFSARRHFGQRRRYRLGHLLFAYGSVVVLSILLIWATVQDLLPPFFIQELGPTLWRQVILGTAVVFWALSGILMLVVHRQTRIEFHFWYGLALVMTAIGLGGVFFESATGSLLNWAGRLTQILGGIYFGMAVLLLLREGQLQGIAFELRIADFFRESEANYRALVDTITDALIAVDDKGRILLWNPAAERMFGYGPAEVLGVILIDLVLLPEMAEKVRQEWQDYTLTGTSPLLGKSLELIARRKNGEFFPVEYTVSARRKGNRWDATVIVRDITERKQAEALSQALNLINETIHSTLSSDEVMHRTVTQAARALGCDTAAISLRQGDQWVVSYVHGFPKEIIGTVMNDEEEPHAVLAIKTKQVVAVSDAFEDERVNRAHMQKWGVRSVLVVPLLSKERAIGVMFFNYESARFALNSIHIDFGNKLAAAVSLALENARLYGSLEQELAERKQAEVALRASEERYRSLFEQLNEGFALHEILCDAQDVPIDYRFLEINPAFEHLTGLKRQEVIGKLHSEVLPNDNPNRVEIYGRVARTGESIHFEDYSPALGQHYEVFAYRPAPRQFAVLFLNITERKQAEERIHKLNEALEHQSEELQQMNLQLEETLGEEQVAREEAETGRNTLESLMQYAPEAIFIADAPNAQIRMVSQYVEHITGRPLSELTGVPTGLHPVSQDLFRMDGTTPMAFEDLPIVRAVKRGETVLDQEMILRRSDGIKRTLLVNAGPVRDGKGSITGGIAVWRDISARKQMEQQVVELNRNLQQRALELEIANRELESFSYSISHDLRMPLASINGFAQILLKDYELCADARRFVELIRDNSDAMNQLVEGLLRFSRSIRQPLQKQKVDLQQLACQAVEDLSSQQAGRHVEIEVRELPPCEADPLLLKQVLINLLSNAVKFTRPRETARIELNWMTSQEGKTVYFVRDNGIGFDAAQAERLFGVFQRLHPQEEYEGTGVGLAIVERIIRRHGGRVWAEAEVDKGATFYFMLPAGNSGS